MSEPTTLVEAVTHFADEDVCHETLLGAKWPDGKIVCPKCGGDKIGRITSRRKLQCKAPTCRRQFSAKVGTVFEDSPLPLSQWFVAVWCVANAKNGISSYELARALGVTQTTAWFMLHRIRLAMTTPAFGKLSGVVESDETFVGGKAANMHKKRREKTIHGRGPVGKVPVHGLLQRGDKDTPSQVRAAVVTDTEAATLIPQIARNVERGSVVCTDLLASYRDVAESWVHQAVDHNKEYVVGSTHTNGLENFWSLLKRTLKGTYVHVAKFHLFRYVGEQVFRFNERTEDDAARFGCALRGAVGKRLTFRVLCQIDGAGFMGLE